MRPAMQHPEGLYGCGRLTDHEGAPLRPGGLALTEELIKLAAFCPGDRVVDVGCGQGASTRLLIRFGVEAIGVDIDAYAGARATTFVVADAARLPFADGSFDGLLTECVLSAVADPESTLDEWARVLKPGGRVALSDVYSHAGVETARIRTRGGLTRDLVEAGFRVERFDDRSEALRRWVAEFIFGYGSLDALCGGAVDRATLGQSRPGYCLLIAQKLAAHSEERRHG